MAFTFDYRPSDSALVDLIYATQSDGDQPESFMSLAANQWEMVITQEDGVTQLTVRGPETQAGPAPIPQRAQFLGIVFKLGTFMPILPTQQIVNSEIILPHISRRSFWLHGSAWEFPTYENADTFIQRLICEEILASDPVVDATSKGYALNVSERTLQRRFLHATGLTQKAIQQVDRAREALALLQKGTPILDVVFQLGYFDHAHLTNSLKRFVGQTPSEIVKETHTT